MSNPQLPPLVSTQANGPALTPSVRPPVNTNLNAALNNPANIDNLTPSDISANNDLIQQILQDTDTILELLTKNDVSLNNLRAKAVKEQERLNVLESKVETLENTEKILSEKIIELETENSAQKEQLLSGTSGSEELKMALEKCQSKMGKYKEAVSVSLRRLASIRERIEKINNSVKVQGSVIEEVSVGMRGGSNRRSIADTRKSMKYLDIIDSLNPKNTSRARLNIVAKKLGISPSAYRTKGDLFTAIAIIIHAKAGRIRRLSDVKTVALNLNIRPNKTRKELCNEVHNKLRKISLKKL